MARSAVIVGAGVFGASLARRLTLDGWDVTLVEAVSPGHVRSGSGGESRLIRCCHGTDVWHARSAWRALDLWREIDPDLLVESGVAWFARREDGWEADSERVLRGEGIPCERVAARDLFPDVDDSDLAFVLYEPRAGVLRARQATHVLVAQTMAAGARVVAARAKPDGHAVDVGGSKLEADRVIWACGAWLPGLFANLPGLELRITQQDVFFFAARPGWRTPPVPGWVDYDGAAYGVGDMDGFGVKVCPDAEGPPFDPDEAERVALPENERFARDYLALRFPALADAPLLTTRTCQYELTRDSHFIAAPHPLYDGRVWLLGGGSGHGFKHGPVLAERMEAWITGAEPPDPRFGLGERSSARGLRTAGSGA
jgi:sarcosine oxidase